VIEEALRVILRLSAENGLSRPLRLKVEYELPTDNIDVGFGTVRGKVAESVQAGSRPADDAEFPHVGPPAEEDAPPDGLHPCERDIMELIETGNKRMKREAVVKALSDTGKNWGESTVWRYLSKLTKTKHLSRGDSSEHGYGYGLTFWD
jgi:hypothetical protein